MSVLKYHPEFEALNLPQPPAVTSIREIREYVANSITQIFPQTSLPPEIQKSKHSVTSQDGTPVSVIRFATSSHLQSTTPQPAVVYLFGGGLVAGNPELYAPLIADYVLGAGVQFFAVAYRLAPEHPAPAALEDAFATVQWLSTHGPELAVDPQRLGIMGDSAGGGIAAGTALLARDRKLSPPLAKQILISPMLDDRTITRVPETSPLKPFLSWTMENNKIGWTAYLGADKAGKPEVDVSPYTAPGRAENVEDLPSTYLEVGNLDLFREEGTSYAARLVAANLDVEFHLWRGMPHGINISSLTPVQTATKSRICALQSF